MRFERLLTTPVSSSRDLLKLADLAGVRVDQIDFKQYMNRDADYAILNMGTPALGGTHWVAVANRERAYFDPLGLPRPVVIPPGYAYREMGVQDPRHGRCGQYCVLWLWHVQHGSADRFFEQFAAL